MAIAFQFAFLGPEHSYVASSTKTAKDCPLDPSLTHFYGLPPSFQVRYERAAAAKYIYNIRGHDFLSHTGQFTSMKKFSGPLSSNATIYGEISELHELALDDGAKLNRKADLKVSFGPNPGSFFADAPRLKRYRWANLPPKLERHIQNHVCLHGYQNKEKIHDVAINGSNGWVLQLKGGSQFFWGGRLPVILEEALASASGQRNVAISKLFMNHQHPTEYVLIFSDGRVYIELHQDFELTIRRLLKLWADDRKKTLDWHFDAPCTTRACSENTQQQKNAAYYSRRGLFHLGRRDPALAYEYLREAHSQDSDNMRIRNDYARALIALRPIISDPILEEYLRNGNDEPSIAAGSDRNADFRLQYYFMLRNIKMLEGSRMENRSYGSEWSFTEEKPAASEMAANFVVESPQSAGAMGSRGIPSPIQGNAWAYNTATTDLIYTQIPRGAVAGIPMAAELPVSPL